MKSEIQSKPALCKRRRKFPPRWAEILFAVACAMALKKLGIADPLLQWIVSF